MLLKAGATKIHVCAHSNTAVDQICKRLATTGLQEVTTDEKELAKLILRVGSLEYELDPLVKKYTTYELIKQKKIKERTMVASD